MVGRILEEVKEYTLPSILTPVCMIVEVATEMIIPLLMASIIDDGVYAGNMQHIVKIGLLMVGSAVIAFISGVMGGRFAAVASTGLARNLRKSMYERIQTFSFSNIDRFSTSSLVTRLTTDVTNIQNAYQMMLRMAMRAPTTLIIAMFMTFKINSHIAQVYLYAVIFLAIVIIIIMSSATKLFRQAFPKYDALNESVQENVTAIRVVKAYVRENEEISRFKKASKAIYDIFCKAEGKVVLNMPIMTLTVYTCILTISWMGAKMISVGDLKTGELMSLLTYCMNILISLMLLSMIFVMITMSAASAERIAEVLDEESDIRNPENPVTEVKDGSVSFKNVSFAYNFDKGGKPVLENINLEIKSGETIGIMGATGSSKSTLVSLISRLYDTTEGSVSVGGRDVKEYDLTTLRDSVSVVLQKNQLFSGTILENLRWGKSDATEEECKKACEMACADEFVSKMPDGYNTHIEQGGTNVSGGQKQRLCIARALLKNPKILILDDSTSAVDTATDAKIRQAFRSQIPGVTKFIIAQRISSIQDSDRIIVLDNGHISGIGTHDELLENNEIYREVFESQTGGSRDFDETEVG
ncbi:MAG: ABC transporter ATP-binding protein [Lachnospiraceae bacterium]|nr:ABC transporter ATP-binding protein [Lachnospiraceae bacterium]